MTKSAGGILDQRLTETAIAAIDFETTGFSPGHDRVVEVAVVRIEPGSGPKLVLDTLVRPNRRMAATEVHGIRDGDVADAPTFDEIAGELLAALSGCVVAAHNVSFDMSFLRFELGRLDAYREMPHVCTRFLRPILGRVACGLDAACRAERIDFRPTHSSRADAAAAADLWMRYRAAFLERKLATFRDLTCQGKRYKFLSSFQCEMFRHRAEVSAKRSGLKPRK